MATTLQPYVFYYGRCEEALRFYKTVFGGDYELSRVGDGPMAEEAPKETHNNVMHASFTADGVNFLASDGRGDKVIEPDEGNISLCISYTDGDLAQKAFDGLAAGGNVKMPLGDAFWGGKFGMVDDKFNIEWMVHVA
jgi:PhnB protein